jgi:methyl-accepting chemotaxis protein
LQSHIHKVGLTWAIFGSFTLALLLILGSLYYFVAHQTEKFLTNKLIERGTAIARQVKRQVALKGREYDEATARTLNEIAESESDVRSILLIGPEGQVVARTFAADARESQQILEQFNRANHPGWLELPNGRLLVASQIFVSPGPGVGYVLLELDRSSADAVVAALQRSILAALLVGSAVFAALAFGIPRVFMAPSLTALSSATSKLSEGDLTVQVEAGSSTELANLANSLNRMGQGLRGILVPIQGAAEGVAQMVEQISAIRTAVGSNASTILSQVEETSSSMIQVLSSLRGIAQDWQLLCQNAEESLSSISEMGAANQKVAEGVEAMTGSVEETTRAVEELTRSIKEVANYLQELDASSVESSSSMREMEGSINQLEINASETARLSEQMSTDAATAVQSVRKALVGVDKIQESSSDASTIVETLGKRILEVGDLLKVIDDVADQTNLLALNAAIMAAQAGEQGKGFAVVADEIKELAERTGISTKGIGEIIRAVQEESRNAVAAMNDGVHSVREGIKLGQEAEVALEKIHAAASKATSMARAIAQASEEQSRGSKQVTASIRHIAETVQRTSRAYLEQSKGSEQVAKGAQNLKVIANEVQRSAQEQERGSKQIAKKIESITELANHLRQGQKDQAQSAEHLLKALQTIKGVSEHQARSVRQLEDAFESLKKQANALRTEVRRFRV